MNEHTAEALIDQVKHAFMTLDMNKIIDCFSDDVEVQYNQLPIMQGKPAVRSFLSKRYHGMVNYQLKKKLRAINDNQLTVEVTATFEKNKKNVTSRIFEILTYDGSKISKWEYVGVSNS